MYLYIIQYPLLDLEDKTHRYPLRTYWWQQIMPPRIVPKVSYRNYLHVGLTFTHHHSSLITLHSFFHRIQGQSRRKGIIILLHRGSSICTLRLTSCGLTFLGTFPPADFSARYPKEHLVRGWLCGRMTLALCLDDGRLGQLLSHVRWPDYVGWWRGSGMQVHDSVEVLSVVSGVSTLDQSRGV